METGIERYSMDKLKSVDLFAGIGGLTLGFEQTGLFEPILFVEKDWRCRKVLERHWPNVPQIRLIEQTRVIHEYVKDAAILIGGDPCPHHSKARSNGPSSTPDYSGYFLSLVGRSRARWVVRENVPLGNAEAFGACLEFLGYGTVIVRVNAAPFTSQWRIRDFVIGRYGWSRERLRKSLPEFDDGPGLATAHLDEKQVVAALTTHRTRYEPRDNYVWEPARGLRLLDDTERERLAGFPEGWTDGFSSAARCRMLGNAVVVPVANLIARSIVSIEQGDL